MNTPTHAPRTTMPEIVILSVDNDFDEVPAGGDVEGAAAEGKEEAEAEGAVVGG
jgi:hypothetical protein